METEHLTNICPLLDALKEIQPEEEKEERWRAEREQMWEEKKAEIPLLFLDEKGLIRDGKSAEEMYKIPGNSEKQMQQKQRNAMPTAVNLKQKQQKRKRTPETANVEQNSRNGKKRRRRAMEKPPNSLGS